MSEGGEWRNNLHHYIDGRWIEAGAGGTLEIVDPAEESGCGTLALGGEADVDDAVRAARAAFETFGCSTLAARKQLLERIIECYSARRAELADAVRREMGAPAWLAAGLQVDLGLAHLRSAREVLDRYAFEHDAGRSRIVSEPIGVCALITPWNWPLNQIACKVAPALATGCTMVLKPSELAPFSATLFAEILDEAQTPAGVFNLVHGDGATVGSALSRHPDVDMVSFTGSTRAGVQVALNAAPTIKRVSQELGGKSANLILRSADLEAAVVDGVRTIMLNSGQSCNAPSRMLVPRERLAQASDYARRAAQAIAAGPGAPGTQITIGPVASRAQFEKIQGLIRRGMEEGATLVAGGPGRPDGVERGFYVRPTVFADVHNDMTIAREEIFGPVLVMIGYDSEEDAIAIANDTPYGLAAYVQGEPGEARRVAARLRAGQVVLNGASLDTDAPFGGYKQSGNGREWGEHAFAEYLETKAIVGA
ncbi:aldehyde dehydrogenase family protein [Paraburkholderia unamae]|uniref:Aldehyde dehydrogenase (NAD+) n=1 Tax=Paraburkholderia unamae TaxID=219649 RepID=A0ABX5K7A2_9BURK|nr:aldehyde dehydrogenase family protein [Paraburkholderia unamae]PVX62707.1 aldehyde dehydrogenase (NAD+) [Paraburkholderia unamae]